MRILVTGAGGFVGGHLLPRLEAEGHEVVRLRRGAAGDDAPGWTVPSLAAAETAPLWPSGIEAVVHLAAANPARNEKGAGDETALDAANVDGTAALARRSAREGVERFVFLSSANVHASRSDARAIDETDRMEPQSAYARSKARAEEALRAALGGTETRYCILRPAPVFGEGGRGTVAQLARLAASPFPVPLEGLGGRRSLIAVDDLVDAILAALRVEAPQNGTLLLAGGAATPAQIVRALREGAGRPARLLPAPRAGLRFLARRLGKSKSFDALTSDFVLDTKRAEEALGWKPRYGLLERLRQLGRASRGAPPAGPIGGTPVVLQPRRGVAEETSRPLRVLLLSQYYWPETFLVNEVVDDLRARGCDVTVLTGQPNYPDGDIFPGYAAWRGGRQRHPHGYDIVRVPVLPRKKGGVLRVLNYASFVLSASFLGPWLLRGQRYDVVFVYAVSPILQALPAIVIGRLKRAALVVWVQDLWPDTLRSAGGITSERVLRSVSRLTRFIYRRCDLLLAQSNGFVGKIREVAGAGVPILVHPNPGPANSGAPSHGEPPLALDPGFNILFAGNFGTAQSMGTILDAAELLAARDCRFVLVGSGSKTPWLREEIARRGLRSTVHLAGRFPPSAMPSILGQASALLVTLARSGNLALTVPSKVPCYLAAGKPILGSLDGEANEIIRQSGAGFAVAAEDPHALAEAVERLLALGDEERAAMGQAGRDYFARHFAPAELAAGLERHLRHAVAVKRERRAEPEAVWTAK